ncbi:hypothetical protein SLE2022_295330 [Rubroshorea leprosula]
MLQNQTSPFVVIGVKLRFHIFNTLQNLMSYLIMMVGIRAVNATFAFTSFGVKVDKAVTKKPNPCCFRIFRQNCHKMGSLLLILSEKPKFAQLYIIDIANEIENRVAIFDDENGGRKILRKVLETVNAIVDRHNKLV